MSDPGGQGLRGHGVADADDRMTSPSRPSLQCDVEPVPPGSLERPERHPVDRMHDRRDALGPGGRPAEDPGLRTVRVDDFGLQSPERRAQLPIGGEVNPGSDRPDQLAHHFHFQPRVRGPLEQVAFRPFRRAGDERDVVAIVMV